VSRTHTPAGHTERRPLCDRLGAGCITGLEEEQHGRHHHRPERTEAERVVRNLVGVKGVTNLVTIRPGTAPAPKELKNH
jgi:hypothetical protein